MGRKRGKMITPQEKQAIREQKKQMQELQRTIDETTLEAGMSLDTLENTTKSEYFDQNALQRIYDLDEIKQRNPDLYNQYVIQQGKVDAKFTPQQLEEISKSDYFNQDALNQILSDAVNDSKNVSASNTQKNIIEQKINNMIENSVAEQAVKESGEKVMNSTVKNAIEETVEKSSKSFNWSALKPAGKYLVGGLALAGLINMISDSRGSMSNDQRFNPGGPLVI